MRRPPVAPRNGFGLADALSLMETARKNRQAEIGLFVFSSRLAPDGIEPLSRHDIEARGGTFVLVEDGKVRVEPPDRITPSEQVFLQAHRDEARRLVRYQALHRPRVFLDT